MSRVPIAQPPQLKDELPSPRFSMPVTVSNILAVLLRDGGDPAVLFMEPWHRPSYAEGGVVQLEGDGESWRVSSVRGIWARRGGGAVRHEAARPCQA
jgi:hypothetical protein